MTTFFGGPGFGGAGTMPASRESKALAGIDSRTKPFVNKDFVRNIQWLNASVDTLSVYTQKLQQGVDAANQNALEQIQGFVADLIVIFAGGSPTGINLGDLQYIFQAMGAMLGVNPDTVFPLNLVEAVGNMFDQFIVPLPQFTDVIFDAMILWMEELGFSDEAVAAVQEFNDAAADLYYAWNDVGKNIIPAINDFLKMLGWGSGWLSLDFLKSFIKDVQKQLDVILAQPKQLLINLLNNLIVTLFKSMTWLVNMINPRNIMATFGLQNIGPQLAPAISDQTTIWQVGSNPNTQWVYTTAEFHAPPGSFTTNGNAYGKRILTQGTEVCTPGETLAFSGWLKWQGVPVGQNQFGPCIAWMSGLNEVSVTNIDAPTDREIDGGWQQVGRNVVVPENVDGFKIGYRCGAQINLGQIWAGELSCAQLSVTIDVVGGIVRWIQGLFLSLFSGIPELTDLSVSGVTLWLKTLLNQYSPLSAQNLVGLIPSNLLAMIPIGSLMSVQPNLLANWGFDTHGSIQGQEDWIWDAAIGHSKFGSVRVDVTQAKNRELFNTNWIPVEPGQKFTFQVWARWSGLGGWMTAPIVMGINEFGDMEGEEALAVKTLAQAGNMGPSSDWVQLQAVYTVPVGVRLVKYRLQVHTGATAGSIWFDDAVARRTSLLQWSLIDNLESAWNGLLSALTGIATNVQDFINGMATDPIGYLGAQWTNITTRLQSLLPEGLFDAAWLTNILNIPQLSDLSVPGVLNVVDNIVTSLFGWTGVGFSHKESAEALEAMRQTTEANSAALRLWMQQLSSGTVIVDSFNRIGGDLGPNYWQSYTPGQGQWATDGTKAYWNSWYPNGIREGSGIHWTPTLGAITRTRSDYQDVGVVLAGTPETYYISVLGIVITEEYGWNDIFARVANDRNTYLQWRWNVNSWRLYYHLFGAHHLIASGWLPHALGAGIFPHMKCGDILEDNPYPISLWLGPRMLYQWNDPGKMQQLGIDFRGSGFGGRVEGTTFTFMQRKPAPLSQFLVADQVKEEAEAAIPPERFVDNFELKIPVSLNFTATEHIEPEPNGDS